MRGRKYYLYLSDDERSRIIQVLVDLKNKLIAEGRYTDAVDEVIYKVSFAKQRMVKINTYTITVIINPEKKTIKIYSVKAVVEEVHIYIIPREQNIKGQNP